MRPLNCYGWSKALFDRKVACERDEFRPVPPQYAGLKFFNVYGPNEYHKGTMKSVIAHIFPIARQNDEVKLFKSYHPDYKDGWQLRDFVWVGESCSPGRDPDTALLHDLVREYPNIRFMAATATAPFLTKPRYQTPADALDARNAAARQTARCASGSRSGRTRGPTPRAASARPPPSAPPAACGQSQ